MKNLNENLIENMKRMLSVSCGNIISTNFLMLNCRHWEIWSVMYDNLEINRRENIYK